MLKTLNLAITGQLMTFFLGFSILAYLTFKSIKDRSSTFVETLLLISFGTLFIWAGACIIIVEEFGRHSEEFSIIREIGIFLIGFFLISVIIVNPTGKDRFMNFFMNCCRILLIICILIMTLYKVGWIE